MLMPLTVAPIQLVVYFWLLGNQIGVSVVAGFILLIVIFPLNILVFKSVVYWYKEILTAADTRVKLVNEMLQVGKSLKEMMQVGGIFTDDHGI